MIFRIGITLLVTSVLIFSSTAPRSGLKRVPILGAASKYELHVLSAFVLTLLLWWWLAKRLRSWVGVGSFVASLAVAGAVEVVQTFIPHRGGNLQDLKPALVGSAIAVAFASLITWVAHGLLGSRLSRHR